MKQRYVVSKDKNTGDLTIKEFAELDKELFSLICEESYDGKTIQAAVKDGKMALISGLRTPNMYPIAEYIDRIADTVMDMYQKGSESEQPVELEFDDIVFMKDEEDQTGKSGEGIEIDDLLEVDEADSASEKGKTSKKDDPLDLPDDDDNE